MKTHTHIQQRQIEMNRVSDTMEQSGWENEGFSIRFHCNFFGLFFYLKILVIIAIWFSWRQKWDGKKTVRIKMITKD